MHWWSKRGQNGLWAVLLRIFCKNYSRFLEGPDHRLDSSSTNTMLLVMRILICMLTTISGSGFWSIGMIWMCNNLTKGFKAKGTMMWSLPRVSWWWWMYSRHQGFRRLFALWWAMGYRSHAKPWW
jgi:hypothetical protein